MAPVSTVFCVPVVRPLCLGELRTTLPIYRTKRYGQRPIDERPEDEALGRSGADSSSTSSSSEKPSQDYRWFDDMKREKRLKVRQTDSGAWECVVLPKCFSDA